MWTQDYNPFNNQFLSAIIAALPVFFFLIGLTKLKLKGIMAALYTLIISIVVAIVFFGMPFTQAAAAVLQGVINGLWPIGYIVIASVWLYKISVKSGKFDIIRGSISSLSDDHRLQLLLIGFCFNAFLEGAAGFGVPIAISAALLTELGFKPLKAAMLCLIANAASGAFGAIGIPTIMGATMANVTPVELSRMLIWTLSIFGFVMPFILVFILDKTKGIKETWPALLVVSLSYGSLQTATMAFIGPELADIIPSLGSMAILAIFLQKWQPANIYREEGAEEIPAPQKFSAKEVVSAWSPFLILTATIFVWSLSTFQALFADGGALSATTLVLSIPGLDGMVIRIPPISSEDMILPAKTTIGLISATGTAILVSIILTCLSTKSMSMKKTRDTFNETMAELTIPIVTICLVMGFANLANFAGLSATIGLALAEVGDVFPLLSPIIGWTGVFITGSVVNNNALFGNLQYVTANQIGANSTLLVGANTAGGVMGKLISPQSIAIATAAVKKTGQESLLLRMTLKYSLGFLAFVCVWTFILAVFIL